MLLISAVSLRVSVDHNFFAFFQIKLTEFNLVTFLKLVVVLRSMLMFWKGLL